MTYKEKLSAAAEGTGSLLCMGIDPVPEYLPRLSNSTGENITSFFTILFSEMAQTNTLPGAFKPNLGFFTCLDRPRDNDFSGSKALSDILTMVDTMFPDIPVILDYKRGDIARSSANYAVEGFVSWRCDSVTVSPWMGSDSVEPFLKEAHSHSGGVYLLNRTSNPGGREFQSEILKESGRPVFLLVAEHIIKWAEKYPGTGAITGATSPGELESLATVFKEANIPLLIPGVGSQGGSASQVIKILKRAEYNLALVRINVSSAITHPWAKESGKVPANWKEICLSQLRYFNSEAGRM